MKIVADENIILLHEVFSTLGDVAAMPGRSITCAQIKDADVLLVRTTTPVSANLLEGSAVRFVGSPTAGEDHIDKTFLKNAGVAFSTATGSNANSVAEYVIAASLEVAHERGLTLSELRLGIVGVGHIGSRVCDMATALGMQSVWNDPPLQEATGDGRYRPIEEILDCDIVTLHVPLTANGPYPTYHLIGEDDLRRMKPGAILINTSRGPVVDNAGLLVAMENGHIGAAILDVWEGEPEIDTALLQQVAIGTPHIAGYSYDGKMAGTRMVYEALCGFLHREPSVNFRKLAAAEDAKPNRVSDSASEEEAVRNLVAQAYPIREDDTRLRKLIELPAADRGLYFDHLRKTYPKRREWWTRSVVVPQDQPELRQCLAGLGFNVIL